MSTGPLEVHISSCAKCSQSWAAGLLCFEKLLCFLCFFFFFFEEVQYMINDVKWVCNTGLETELFCDLALPFLYQCCRKWWGTENRKHNQGWQQQEKGSVWTGLVQKQPAAHMWIKFHSLTSEGRHSVFQNIHRCLFLWITTPCFPDSSNETVTTSSQRWSHYQYGRLVVSSPTIDCFHLWHLLCR